MSLLGLGVTGKVKETGGVYFVEYHQCDKCNTEFKIYFKSNKALQEAMPLIAQILGNSDEDLCFTCQSEVPADQMIMSV